MRCLSPIITPFSGTLSDVVRLRKPFYNRCQKNGLQAHFFTFSIFTVHFPSMDLLEKLVACSLYIVGSGCLSGKVYWSIIFVFLFHLSCSGKKEFLCGAALIEQQWIITAAHCFMQRHQDDHVRRPLTTPPEM